MFHFQVLCFCDNKPASSTGQNRDRDQSLRQVRAAQVETSEVAHAPLDKTIQHYGRSDQLRWKLLRPHWHAYNRSE